MVAKYDYTNLKYIFTTHWNLLCEAYDRNTYVGEFGLTGDIGKTVIDAIDNMGFDNLINVLYMYTCIKNYDGRLSSQNKEFLSNLSFYQKEGIDEMGRMVNIDHIHPAHMNNLISYVRCHSDILRCHSDKLQSLHPIHYEGKLGVFDYDQDLFKVVTSGWDCGEGDFHYLLYIGAESDGTKIQIPNGIKNCSYMFGGYDGDGTLTNPPVIPDSVKICECMFANCPFLTTPPVIPEGVVDCSAMFINCVSLVTAPVIPKSVAWCDDMFAGCTSLVSAPVIPKGVKYCDCMFNGCESLVEAPAIPDSVVNCSEMFYECTSLVSAPVIPESVKNCLDTFYGCSDEVQIQGEWNIEHRGMNHLQDYVEENETDELY